MEAVSATANHKHRVWFALAANLALICYVSPSRITCHFLLHSMGGVKADVSGIRVVVTSCPGFNYIRYLRSIVLYSLRLTI